MNQAQVIGVTEVLGVIEVTRVIGVQSPGIIHLSLVKGLIRIAQSRYARKATMETEHIRLFRILVRWLDNLTTTGLIQ